MSKITHQIKYDRTILMYAASSMLERSAFYGMRSIMLIYMVNGAFSFSENDAMMVYSFFVMGLVGASVLGALLGDFILGNRNALLAGTILMTLGLFLLCIPVKEVFYGSLVLVLIGSGLYTPNLISRYGKQFYTKPELIDGGLSVLYLFVNVGAFIGVGIVAVVSINNYIIGFALSGLLMLGSAILSFINKDNTTDERQDVGFNSLNSALIILVTILGLGLYWYIYEISTNGLYYLELKIMELNKEINPLVWQNLSTGMSIAIGVAFAVIYSFYYFGRPLKLAFGLLLSAAAIGLALLIPASDQNGIVIMFFVILLLSLAELVMAPVLYGLIIQRTNPKYLALIISLTFIPGIVFKKFMPKHFIESIPSDNILLKVAAPVLLFMGITTFVFWIVKKLMKN